MRIIVISPEARDPREVPVLAALLAAGLGRYHVRKPGLARDELRAFLQALPESWLPKVALHGHADLAAEFGLGTHERDADPEAGAGSRSCHDFRRIPELAGRHRTVLFGPVGASISKPGYGPRPDFPWDELRSVLRSGRRPGGGQVYAVGGVGAADLSRLADLGFDGAAVLGAVWRDRDPVRAFEGILAAAERKEAATRGA
jgi:thiamine-phosphate pyrophosphorylase